MTDVPPLDCLVEFTADGGFYGWSCPTQDGLHTVIVSNEEGWNPRALGPDEGWSVFVLRDSDARSVSELAVWVPPGRLAEVVGLMRRTDWTGR